MKSRVWKNNNKETTDFERNISIDLLLLTEKDWCILAIFDMNEISIRTVDKYQKYIEYIEDNDATKTVHINYFYL